MSLIKYNKSIIPSLDVNSLEKLREVVSKTCKVEGIGAYKIGFELVLPFGMNTIVDEIRKFTDLPIIYDHQKAGTDIPDTGIKFAKACAGVDAVIIFPQAGPKTELAWIDALQDFKVIVGGEMTHDGYLEKDDGFIMDNAPERIYTIAAKKGVKHFVVPGNKPEKIEYYKKIIEQLGVTPIFYSPGLVTQGGDISSSGKAAGEFWHAIVGRALYNANNIEEKARELVRCLK